MHTFLVNDVSHMESKRAISVQFSALATFVPNVRMRPRDMYIFFSSSMWVMRLP